MGPQPRAAVAVLLLAACGPTSPVATDGDGGGDDAPDAPPGTRPDAGPVQNDCHALPITLRDFSPSTHPDFEPFSDSDFAYPGLVRSTLGSDDKPIYAHPGATPHTAGPVEFAQWYRDTDGINLAFSSSLPLVEASPGVFAFDSAAFFPLDGMGYGDEGLEHNFHFTTEIHTTFEYRGGEAFTFTGDDDLWLFINKRLAIDLGGLHPSLSGTVDLDAQASALGLEPGQTYAMDIFHAERHTDASNFHVETTIDCFVVP
jgi:fibro-slime domain-containing protein